MLRKLEPCPLRFGRRIGRRVVLMCNEKVTDPAICLECELSAERGMKSLKALEALEHSPSHPRCPSSFRMGDSLDSGENHRSAERAR